MVEVRLQVRSLDEPAGSYNGLYLCCLAPGSHVDGPGGEVQHGRSASEGMKAKHRDEASDGAWQHHSDDLFSRSCLGKFPAQYEGAHNQPIVGRGIALNIFNYLVPSSMGLARIKQRLKQCPVDVRCAEHHVGHHIIELVSLMDTKG